MLTIFYFTFLCPNFLVTVDSFCVCKDRMASNAAEDIEAWAQAEGVPSLADPFIQKYMSGRDALVEQEKKQRSGR